MTNGDKGAGHKPDTPHAEVAKTRFREASAVADAIGARFVNPGAEDEYLFDTRETRNALAALRGQGRRRSAPSPNCYQSDHTTTSEMAFMATHVAALPQLDIEGEALPTAPAMYHYDTILGLDFEPSFFIDVGDVMERKKDLARMHESQMQSMKSQSDWDLVEAIEVVGGFRGLQSGVRYAEAYQLRARYPRGKALKAFPA
jgi:LmbE family N-acetylglucosaminyl deacetylase